MTWVFHRTPATTSHTNKQTDSRTNTFKVINFYLYDDDLSSTCVTSAPRKHPAPWPTNILYNILWPGFS